MSAKQIELKLALQPADLAQLLQHRFLQDFNSSSTLNTVYWDSPDLTLAHAGIVVRVRSSDDHCIQGAWTSSGQEWQWPINAPELESGLKSSRLTETGLEIFSSPTIAESLAPILSTTIHRTHYRISDENWEVALILDRGEIGTGYGHAPICEAKLKLIRGPAEKVFAIAQDITNMVPARVITLSKADHGAQLLAGTPPLSMKSKSSRIDSHLRVDQAFRAIARNCLSHLLSNEHCLLAHQNGEAIHQMRVALRRLRSAIRIFSKVVNGAELELVRQDLSWLLQQLGPARDDYVFLDEIVAPVMTAHPTSIPLAMLRAEWEDQHAQHFKAALEAVTDRRFTSLVLRVSSWVEAGDWQKSERPVLDKAISPFAQAVLSKRDRRLRKAGGKDLRARSPEDLHHTRILGKQLRYASEFFSPLWPKKETQPFLTVMSELQDHLGKLNDIADRKSVV